MRLLNVIYFSVLNSSEHCFVCMIYYTSKAAVEVSCPRISTVEHFVMQSSSCYDNGKE